MKRLNNISVFRLAIFLFLTVLTNSKTVFITIFLYYIFFNRKELMIFVILCLFTFLSVFLHSIDILDIENPVKTLIISRIQTYPEEISSSLNKILLNINDYQNSYNLGYGLSFYYVCKYIKRKNPIIALVTIVFISILFGFQIKYLVALIEIILDRIKTNVDKSLFLVIIVCIIIPLNIKDLSILIILTIKLIVSIKSSISIEFVLSIFQSLFFNKISLSILLYKYLLSVKIFMIFVSVITLLFKRFSGIYLFFIQIYSKFNDFIDIGIRGKITYFSLIVIFLIIREFRIKNRIYQIALLLLILILPINNPFFSINYIDVGQGDSILIKDVLNKGNVLIDTGSKYSYFKLKNYLFSKSIYSIDYLVITHNDEDHNGNIDNLKKDFKIKNIMTSREDIDFNNIKLKYIDIGEYDNDNDNSLVYYGYFNNKYFLFTADVSSKVENHIIEKFDRKVEVLKVSHHGSKYSSSEYFISKILPKYSIISTNGKYNHPSDECIENLSKFLSKIYITKNEGNIEYIFTIFGDFIKTNRNIQKTY